MGSFSSKAKQIAKREDVSVKRGRAILASAARKASPAAKRKNPNLTKVAGVGKRKAAGKLY